MPEGKLGDLGPCEFVWDYGDSPHENFLIKETFGDVTVNDEDNEVEIRNNRFGVMPVSHVNTGNIITVEVPFTQLEHQDFVKLFPDFAIVQSGNELIWKACVGRPTFPNAKSLLLRPLLCSETDADRGKWIEFFRAHPMRQFSIAYGVETQRIYQVTFNVYPIQEGANKGYLYKWGD